MVRRTNQQEEEGSARLLRSDAAYFRIAAESQILSGATFYYMPRFRLIPAASVVVSDLDIDSKACGPDWIEHLEDVVQSKELKLVRVYVRDGSAIDETFQRNGNYERRVELGYFSPEDIPAPRSVASLTAVTTPLHWDTKRSIHCASKNQPDGYDVPAEEWIDFEREKCRQGLMTAYLTEIDGSAAATICAFRDGPYLRLKNLVVHPGFRRKGLATQIVHSLWENALHQGLSGIFALAISGSPAEDLYQHANLRQCGRIIEWRRWLGIVNEKSPTLHMTERI